MDFKIYKSDFIIENQKELINQIHHCHQLHQQYFNGKDSTWTYSQYNFFALSSPSILFNNLFQELKNIITEYVPNETKWMQSWLNYHHSNQVLDWHDHYWDYHGYICIDPKKTRTIFENYEIINEVGNIYIGPGYRKHKVIVDEEYEEPRITLGFDVQVSITDNQQPNSMLSLIPI